MKDHKDTPLGRFWADYQKDAQWCNDSMNDLQGNLYPTLYGNLYCDLKNNTEAWESIGVSEDGVQQVLDNAMPQAGALYLNATEGYFLDETDTEVLTLTAIRATKDGRCFLEVFAEEKDEAGNTTGDGTWWHAFAGGNRPLYN